MLNVECINAKCWVNVVNSADGVRGVKLTKSLFTSMRNPYQMRCGVASRDLHRSMCVNVCVNVRQCVSMLCVNVFYTVTPFSIYQAYI